MKSHCFSPAALLIACFLLFSSFVPNEEEAPDTYCNYAVACISNTTWYSITYSVRWGYGTWTAYTVNPGETMRHWCTYTLYDNCASPQLQINFDYDATWTNYYKTYDLDRYQSLYTDCSAAKQYQFQYNPWNSNLIDLYSVD